MAKAGGKHEGIGGEANAPDKLAPVTRPTHLAQGRWLGDFEPLSAVERDFIAKCAAGKRCALSEERPESPNADNVIRSDLLRFAILGGDQFNPVHERGVFLVGGWIGGRLDLDNTNVISRIGLISCRFEDALCIRDATLAGLYLNGSLLPGLLAERMVVKGSVILRDAFVSSKEIRLLGAKIGGDLDCLGSSFSNCDDHGNVIGNTIHADLISVEGSILFRDGFSSLGTIRLLGAKIGGDLDCFGGFFSNSDKDANALGEAIFADGIVIGGSVLFTNGFTSVGEVRIKGARIERNLECTGGIFLNRKTEVGVFGKALCADSSRVKGAFHVRGASFGGGVDLSGVHVASLVDDAHCWPANGLLLDGFNYGGIGDGPTDAHTRVRWLQKQIPEALGAGFCPQPWEHLLKVLLEMGHAAEATEVAIAKQIAMRRAGKIGLRKPRYTVYQGWRLQQDKLWATLINFLAIIWHHFYGRLAGFGYRPARILLWMMAVWFLSGAYFSTAATSGLMAPTRTEIYAHRLIHADLGSAQPDGATCGIQREVAPPFWWTQCKAMPSEYTTFNSWVYSLDLILPLVDLQQDSDWAPAATYIDSKQVTHNLPGGMIARGIMWFEILFGWFTSLMFIAIVSRLVEKD
jgi:hypothetical protein